MNKSIDKTQEAMRVEQALKLALEALGWYDRETHQKAITAIREALMSVPDGAHAPPVREQPAPVAEPHKQQSAERGEPVAMHEDWYDSNSCGHCGMVGGHASTCRHYKPTSPPNVPTARASKPWRGLTDKDLAGCDDEEFKQARYWEQVLREKNT